MSELRFVSNQTAESTDALTRAIAARHYRTHRIPLANPLMVTLLLKNCLPSGAVERQRGPTLDVFSANGNDIIFDFWAMSATSVGLVVGSSN